MKKVIIFIGYFFLIFGFNKHVVARTGLNFFGCYGNVGETVSCELIVIAKDECISLVGSCDDGDPIQAINYVQLEIDSTKGKVINFEPTSSWTSSVNENQITLNRSSGMTEAIETAGIFNFSINSSLKDGEMFFISIPAKYKIATEENLYDFDSFMMLYTNSNDATLSNLKIGENSLTLKQGVYTYNFTTTEEQVKISAIQNDHRAEILSGEGQKNLSLGVNSFNIVVKAQTGLLQTYTLEITRNENTSNQNSNNNSNNNSSSQNAQNNQTNTTNSSDPKSNSATNSQKTTNSSVKKTNTASTNNYLLSLLVSYGQLEFEKNKLEYYLEIPFQENKIVVEVKAEDPNAIIYLTEPEFLSVGNNDYIIKVVSESGDERTYKIVINRLQLMAKSSNNYLQHLFIEGYDLDFQTMKYEYDLKIKPSIKSLKIDYTLLSNKATAVIEGNNNLKKGSKIKITVTAEDGTTRNYTITILKENKSYILIITIVGIAIVVGGIIVYKIIRIRKLRNARKSSNISN